jgi:hypothetical protein
MENFLKISDLPKLNEEELRAILQTQPFKNPPKDLVDDMDRIVKRFDRIQETRSLKKYELKELNIAQQIIINHCFNEIFIIE